MTQKNTKRPTIGVTPIWDEKKDSIWMLPGYMQGLEDAGAVPVILPLTISEAVLKQTSDFFDGFLFTGGHDVDPKLYGQEKTELCGEICEVRDKMETYIFREAVLNQNKPALGICRGIQFFNVLLGGTLYQDIPAEFSNASNAISHAQKPPYDAHAHAVKLISKSPLGKLIGEERIEVNSYHHQGINRLAKGLEVMALADDGLVEAVRMPAHPYAWAVQWHPELSLKDEVSKKIFASFVGNAY
jgi:putative glutamine amidotransferase